MKKATPKLTTIYSLDEMPSQFDSEDDEREWWATHELSDELWESLEDVTGELDEMMARNAAKRATRAGRAI